MNAVYSKDGNGRIVSMLTKASASTQGLTKTYLYANFTELTKMTSSEYTGTTRDYTYEHDNAGRLTGQVQNVFSPNSTTTFAYEWDALDRMTKVQKVASGVTKTINYTYNAAGLRARRVDTSTNVTKLWTYQGNNIASVSTKSGGSFGDTSTQEWVYTVGPGMINNVLERHKANYAATTTTSEYYQYDHRGNVAAVTDSTGRILRGYQYDAFGNIPFSFATGQSGAAPTDDILFTGKDLDPDTGLYYFNARWYDSELGYYTRRARYSANLEHPYALSEHNPLRFPDPTGSKGIGAWLKGGGALGTALVGCSLGDAALIWLYLTGRKATDGGFAQQIAAAICACAIGTVGNLAGNGEAIRTLLAGLGVIVGADFVFDCCEKAVGNALRGMFDDSNNDGRYHPGPFQPPLLDDWDDLGRDHILPRYRPVA